MNDSPRRATHVTLSGAPADLGSDATALVRAAWRLDRRLLVAQVVLIALNGVIGGVNLLLLVPIVNVVAGRSSAIDLPVIGATDVGAVPLPALLAAFLVLAGCSALLQRASSINAAEFQPRLVDELRTQAFEAMLAARWTFVLRRRRSDVMAVVTGGAYRCGAAFQQLVRGSVAVVVALTTAVVALVVAPAVAALALVGIVALGLIQATVIRPSHQLGLVIGRRNIELQAVMHNSMDSLRLVRAHDASAIWAERLVEAFERNRNVQIDAVRRSANVSAVSSFVLATAATVLVAFAVWQDVPPTSIVVVLVLLARLARQVDALGGIASQLANSLPAVADIAELTNEARAEVEVPPGRPGRTGALSDDASLPIVELHDVHFTYPGTDDGVHGVSFSVRRGEITVLTGPSGAGKSTSADLVLGLLSPDSGLVIVDGRPLDDVDLPWWRSHVAYVPQETVLLPATLRENLTWSTSDGADDDACWQALDRAAAGFARNLPDGLDTVLGDSGLRLSGGERQRVAIARALLRAPAVLVLDEATSSLDDATETAVLELLSDLAPSVTVLVIAHRRSTIDAAHHIVRLSDGRVVGAE